MLTVNTTHNKGKLEIKITDFNPIYHFVKTETNRLHLNFYSCTFGAGIIWYIKHDATEHPDIHLKSCSKVSKPTNLKIYFKLTNWKKIVWNHVSSCQILPNRKTIQGKYERSKKEKTCFSLIFWKQRNFLQFLRLSGNWIYTLYLKIFHR